MPPKGIMASINETAFDCPHCGAYTTQSWYDLRASRRSDDSRTPGLVDEEWVQSIRASKDIPEEAKSEHLPLLEKQSSGLVCLGTDGYPTTNAVFNLHLSRCFNCKEFSVWRYDKLIFPESRQGPPPNPDMPEKVKADYEEAAKILNLSSRGAAALLRLAIQKLCAELGEKGENINDDIASLVKKGLPQSIQKALDSVRVIGNEAVHPGTIDLKDDSATAAGLFRLVNIIVEQMISNPKHIDEFFEKLPESKRKAIEKRDGKTEDPS
jgi:hypothetical protein